MADYMVDHTAKLTNTKALLTMENNFLFTFLAGRTKEQLLDKGISQKSTKRVGSIVVCSAFCPGSAKRNPLDSGKMACLPKLEYEFLE